MKKLISMTDFIISETNKSNGNKSMLCNKFVHYTNFLKQPLELWMFVPCELIDGVWVVLEEPDGYNLWIFGIVSDMPEYLEYQQAKKRCLFEGFSEKDARFSLFANETIEDLIEYNLQLTKTAEKQIGL